MRTQQYLWLIPLSLTILVGNASSQVTFTKERGGYTARSSETFVMAAGGELVMKDLTGDVSISGDAGNLVRLIQEYFFDVGDEADARKAFERCRAAAKQIGNRLEVIGQKSPWHGDYSAAYEVHVPTNFNAQATTAGGDIQLKGLQGQAILVTAGGDVEASEVNGALTITTAGGDITARAIQGAANLSTAGGDVTLTDGSQGPFALRTSGGDIVAQNIQGDLEASTSGGDVEAREVEGEVDLRTSGGDITLQSVKGNNHRASTSGGDVEAHQVVGNVDLRTSGGEVYAQGVQGSVAGHTSGGDMRIQDISGDVDISTSGGNLEVHDVRGRLAGKTSGGDVIAQVLKGGRLAGPLRLRTSGGEIQLTLPADIQASVSARITIQDDHTDYSVRSDFNLQIEEVAGTGKRGREYQEVLARGDLNGGGPLIELETVNGDIIIDKGN